VADDKSKFKIAIVGIGGVGGFVGGKLAACFEDSESVQIVLAARGENEKAIRADGLKLITTNGEQLIKPKLAATTEIGDADLLLLCTKEYDLEETVSTLKDFIGEQTVILPLLNGVDTAERIVKILPNAEIWQGCIYITSRLIAPGVVQEKGNICLIYFGNGKAKSEKSEFVETVFRQAEIDAHFAEDIEAKMWEKFVFISALAASTSYFNATIGGVLSNQEYKNLLDDLLAEIKRVAAAKKIGISEEAIRQKFDKLPGLPPEVTSSMHTDFSSGKRAELQSLVGYVVEQAKELNVPTPVYDKIYGELAKKQKAVAGG
jgi:2-dehydropantoate 2-reductase